MMHFWRNSRYAHLLKQQENAQIKVIHSFAVWFCWKLAKQFYACLPRHMYNNFKFLACGKLDSLQKMFITLSVGLPFCCLFSLLERLDERLYWHHAVWPDLAKFRQFSKKLQIFGKIWKVYLIFGKVVNPLWDFLYAFGQNFIVVNGQILEKQSDHTVEMYLFVTSTTESRLNRFITGMKAYTTLKIGCSQCRKQILALLSYSKKFSLIGCKKSRDNFWPIRMHY